MTKSELLAFIDASQKALKEKHKGQKYLTREEVEDDLKEMASTIEFVVEQIRKHGTNPHEDRKTIDDIWNGFLDTYKKLKGLFKPPDEKAATAGWRGKHFFGDCKSAPFA